MIPAMIEFIEGLIEKGAAYASDGDVYFDVARKPDYGKLSGKSLDELRAGFTWATAERELGCDVLRIVLAMSRTFARVVPAFKARSAPAWITGPSATISMARGSSRCCWDSLACLCWP